MVTSATGVQSVPTLLKADKTWLAALYPELPVEHVYRAIWHRLSVDGIIIPRADIPKYVYSILRAIADCVHDGHDFRIPNLMAVNQLYSPILDASSRPTRVGYKIELADKMVKIRNWDDQNS